MNLSSSNNPNNKPHGPQKPQRLDRFTGLPGNDRLPPQCGEGYPGLPPWGKVFGP